MKEVEEGKMKEVEVVVEECDKPGGEMALRILLVDDSPVDRKIVENLLKKCGVMFQVIAVNSGKKAMEVLGLGEGKDESSTANGRKIDIILTDYCMPEMTGYDLLKVVKEQTCPMPIPVIIMSSENEPQRISRCRAIGAEDFIQKPLHMKDVQKLKSYARALASAAPMAGAKRKMPLDLMPEDSGAARRPRLAEVAVA